MKRARVGGALGQVRSEYHIENRAQGNKFQFYHKSQMLETVGQEEDDSTGEWQEKKCQRKMEECRVDAKVVLIGEAPGKGGDAIEI